MCWFSVFLLLEVTVKEEEDEEVVVVVETEGGRRSLILWQWVHREAVVIRSIVDLHGRQIYRNGATADGHE